MIWVFAYPGGSGTSINLDALLFDELVRINDYL